ncbi:MAG: PP2C family protein-serine/threonine phosphatase [Colwellia sp.]
MKLSTIRQFFNNAPLQWNINVSCQCGPNKTVNEDAFACNEKAKIAIVCDGVGGGNAGEVASRLASDFLLDALKKVESINKVQLKSILQQCHQHLLTHMEQHPKTQGMATTVVLIVGCKNQVAIMWAGDSRAYLLRKGQLKPLTQDHSFVNEKVAQGIFTREEAEAHAMANLITSALGGKSNSLKHIGYTELNLNSKDRVILMTDGVYGYINKEALLAGCKQSAKTLTDNAITNNTADNCTTLTVDFS